MTFIGRTFEHFDNLFPIDQCDWDFWDDVASSFDTNINVYGVEDTQFGQIVDVIRNRWIRYGQMADPFIGDYFENPEDADPDNEVWDSVPRVNLFSPGAGTYNDNWHHHTERRIWSDARQDWIGEYESERYFGDYDPEPRSG